jgi:hypothetical protein
MKRAAAFSGAMLVSQVGLALAADQAVPPVPPPSPYNFQGENICIAVVKPQVPGIDILAVPEPIVRSEMTPNRRDAKHSIVVGDLGTVAVDEQLGSTEICARFPAETLFWIDNADGKQSTATTCLRGVAGTPRVHVRIAVQATGDARASLKNVVAAVGACDLQGSPTELKPDDTLRIGTAVVPRNRQ